MATARRESKAAGRRVVDSSRGQNFVDGVVELSVGNMRSER